MPLAENSGSTSYVAGERLSEGNVRVPIMLIIGTTANIENFLSPILSIYERGLMQISTTRLLALVLFVLLSFAGLAYLLFLQFFYPTLIPGYGGGERFFLTGANDYTFQIPWFAYSRLHLTLQANEKVELYVDGGYVCDCTNYDFIIEPGEEVLILLKSSSSVSGRFTAWQEIPFENQLLALSLLMTGLAGAIVSLIMRSRPQG